MKRATKVWLQKRANVMSQMEPKKIKVKRGKGIDCPNCPKKK